MIEKYRLSDLPPYAKLFVAIFTTLMLLVLVWVGFIYWVEKGMIDESVRPEYLEMNDLGSATEPVEDVFEAESIEDYEMQEDAGLLAEDSEAVLAPIWDSTFAGRDTHVDSATNIEAFRERDSAIESEAREYGYEKDYGAGTGYDFPPRSGEPREFDVDRFDRNDFRENVGLAHTHINGQTLLFFAIGLVFLFTSRPVKIKKIVYWIFGVSVLTHAIGLSGEGYHWFFDDILALSGVAMTVVMAYMALMIFVDLAKKPRTTE